MSTNDDDKLEDYSKTYFSRIKGETLNLIRKGKNFQPLGVLFWTLECRDITLSMTDMSSCSQSEPKQLQVTRKMEPTLPKR